METALKKKKKLKFRKDGSTLKITVDALIQEPVQYLWQYVSEEDSK